MHSTEAADRSAWRHRLAAGAFWSVVATGVNYALNLLVLALTARFLGRAGYGELGMVTGTVGLFGTLAGLGLGLTATKYVSEYRERDPERAGRLAGLTIVSTIVAAVLTSAALLAAAGVLAREALAAPHLALALRLSAVLLAASTLQSAQVGVLNGFEAFRAVAWNNFLRGAVGVPLSLLGVWMYGVPGAVAGAAATMVMGCVINHWSIRRVTAAHQVPLRWRGFASESAVLWRFSLPALLGGLAVAPVQWGASAIIARIPGGFGELGLLNAAMNWRALLTFLPMTLAAAALPALSSLQRSSRGAADIQDGVETANVLNQVVLWPVAIGLMLLADPILAFYGPGFEAGRVVFVVMIGGTAVGYVGNTLGTLVTAQGRMWFGMLQNVSFGILLLAITAYGAAGYGALAVAAGTYVGYLVLLLWTIVYLKAAGELAAGLALRLVIAGVSMSLATLAALVLPREVAPWLAVPVAVLAAPAVLLLAPGPLRRSLIASVLLRLRAPRAVLS